MDFVAARTARSHVVALTTSVAQPLAQVADSLLLLDFADEESVVQTVFATSALSALRAHLGEDVPPLADRAESVLDEPLADAWLRAEQLTFLGRTWAYGLAEEAALKVRESAQAWTEAYPTMEYRHGPISVAQPGRVVWHLGQGGEELREQVEHTGADFVLHDDDPQVDLVRVQRLGAALAAGRGLDPDQPRHLSRAVLLER